MGTVLTVTAKGQVTLRREVLEHLGVTPGDRLVVELLPSGRVEVRAAEAGSISDFLGSLPVSDAKPLSIEEMNGIAAAGWAGRR